MGKRKEITGKDNGKQKMWIMITVIIVFFAMAGYAGMSYYYSDRFFRGTTINGINCSGKTSEEAEQAVAKKAEDYLLEVKARNLKSQSINGKLIGYRYVSDGSISQYLDEQKPYKWVRGFWKKQNYSANGPHHLTGWFPHYVCRDRTRSTPPRQRSIGSAKYDICLHKPAVAAGYE